MAIVKVELVAYVKAQMTLLLLYASISQESLATLVPTMLGLLPRYLSNTLNPPRASPNFHPILFTI